ncbi:MAG: MBL fold metallo-hydrolase [Defluviitaleaceae bacterium]|nr:MBL fold metallo-hydrolase [Defluviitaleaceae bacterium]
MSISFCTIASGSSGNSAFVSKGKTNILIDAGLSGKRIDEAIISKGFNPEDLTAIFVTHEHIDHIKSVGVISRRHNVPIYLTRGTLAYAEKRKYLGKIAEGNICIVEAGKPIEIGELEINPFSIPHDAVEPVGYTLTDGSAKIAIATDLGHITDEVAKNVAGSDIMLIEANHDIHMLETGPYPQYLKDRILGPEGHLSNVSCGAFLKDIICSRTKYIFLGHLSEENNHPVKAFEMVKNILEAGNVDTSTIKLSMANRHNPSPVAIIS